jgi:hypothetical protein
MKLPSVLLAFALLSISATAQTASDLAAKYGAAHSSYELRPGIFITVKFVGDGRVCEMSLEKRHLQSSGAVLVDETLMSQDEITPIIEELVPVKTRGKETELSGHISIHGVGMTTTYDYENVSITYYRGVDGKRSGKRDIVVRGIAAVVIQWKNRGCN